MKNIYRRTIASVLVVLSLSTVATAYASGQASSNEVVRHPSEAVENFV